MLSGNSAFTRDTLSEMCLLKDVWAKSSQAFDGQLSALPARVSEMVISKTGTFDSRFEA